MTRTALRTNVAANFVGSAWIGLMSVVFIPLYVKLIGIEAYGLIGFFLALQGTTKVFDLGLTTALNREFARLAGMPGQTALMRNLLRTIEIVYCSIGVLNGLAVILLSQVLAEHWMRPEHLSTDVVQRAVLLMGVVITVQWPLGLYAGGLMGLQRQVSLNVVHAVMATVRGVGAVLILWAVSPTVEAYFLWQVVVSIVHTLAVAVLAWSDVGRESATFRRETLVSVWHFAAGVFGIGVVSMLLTQMDKFVVSKVLPLAVFGHYALASAVATSLYRLITPVFDAVFPRLSQLVASGSEAAVAELYHRSSQMLSVMVLPAGLFIAVFAPEVLMLWSSDADLWPHAHGMLSFLVIGTALNGVLTMPYALQLANGWTRLVIGTNVVAIVVLAPTLVLLTHLYGGIGAAMVWPIYNVVAGLVTIGVMHRRLLRGEGWRWVVGDVGLPLLAVTMVLLAGRYAIGGPGSSSLLVVKLFVVAVAVQVAAVAVAPEVRGSLRRAIAARWRVSAATP